MTEGFKKEFRAYNKGFRAGRKVEEERILKMMRKEYPCCMRIRKCKKKNLDGTNKKIICVSCKFIFKLNDVLTAN